MKSFGRVLLAPYRSRRKAERGSAGHNALKLGWLAFVSEPPNEATALDARTLAPGRGGQLEQFIDPALLMLDPVQCMLEMSGILEFGTLNVA
jgi:hypothetical protein